MTLTVGIGAPLGVKLASFFSEMLLKRGFAVFLLLAACAVIWIQHAAALRRGARDTATMTGKNVLIIDDSKVARKRLSQLLAERHIEALETDTATAGLEQLRRSRPDAVFLDLWMPEVDGMAALRAMYDDDAIDPPPVIICSADRAPADERVCAVLSKPYTAAELDRALAKVYPPPASRRAPPSPAAQPAPQPAQVAKPNANPTPLLHLPRPPQRHTANPLPCAHPNGTDAATLRELICDCLADTDFITRLARAVAAELRQSPATGVNDTASIRPSRGR